MPLHQHCTVAFTMETTQQLYRDSPAPSPATSRSSSPAPHHHHATKPLPALPHPNEQYHDDPPTPPHSISASTPPTSYQHMGTYTTQPYSDDSPPQTPIPSTTDDENIPLAHFLLNPYPHESPPSYSDAISQPTTPHISAHQHAAYQAFLASQQPRTRLDLLRGHVVIEIDEESGEVVSRSDDVRFGVERVVAMFVVAALLLVLSGVLGWLALGSGVWV